MCHSCYLENDRSRQRLSGTRESTASLNDLNSGAEGANRIGAA